MADIWMKYFLDTEFIEDGKTIDLISIGIVSEDNRTYYAVNKNCLFHKANNWVKENVIPNLNQTKEYSWRYHNEIRNEVLGFIGDDEKPEFWGYYADYDWVAFCQLFGTMMDLPKNFPMYCKDLKQLIDDKGNPRIPFEPDNEHNALSDAKWNKAVYEWL